MVLLKRMRLGRKKVQLEIKQLKKVTNKTWMNLYDHSSYNLNTII